MSKPFSGDCVEGLNVTKIGKEWWIYFGHYTKPQYCGAYRTSDWKTFEDVAKLITFPGEPATAQWGSHNGATWLNRQGLPYFRPWNFGLAS